MLKTLKDYNFAGKKVLVRCDFNVPIENGRVVDDFKIQKSLQTIRYLKKAGAKIILLSHLGRPQQLKSKKERLKQYSLNPVKKRLEKLLGEEIGFSEEILGRKVKKQIDKLEEGKILLLENLRFEEGEKNNDENFAKSLADLADCYVLEAFGVSHRNHASIVTLPGFLPHFAGFELKKEIEALSQISQAPRRPLTVIIGGKKISSKIKVIEKFLGFSDHILFGGRVANTILTVKGICIGRPWPKDDAIKIINKINLTDPKIHLPVDVLVSPDKTGEIYIRESGPGSVRKDEEILDIGEGTITAFSEVIKNTQTLFWSGPLGYFENEKFAGGTQKIAQAAARKKAFKIVGGGDTVRALKEFNVLDDFSFVSTGGGAMLAFLAGEKLPGIEALK